MSVNLPVACHGKGHITACFAFYALCWSLMAWASDASDQKLSVLDALAMRFSEARALPPGTRPPPPPQINLKALIGLQFGAIRRSLGPPDPQVGGYDFACHASKCWVYTYGAEEKFDERSPDCKKGSALCSIAVTTGGPFILILGLSSGHVVTARWQGQK
jgi:hypothetical protein